MTPELIAIVTVGVALAGVGVALAKRSPSGPGPARPGGRGPAWYKSAVQEKARVTSAGFGS